MRSRSTSAGRTATLAAGSSRRIIDSRRPPFACGHHAPCKVLQQTQPMYDVGLSRRPSQDHIPRRGCRLFPSGCRLSDRVGQVNAGTGGPPGQGRNCDRGAQAAVKGRDHRSGAGCWCFTNRPAALNPGMPDCRRIPAYPGGYAAPELLRRICALTVMCPQQQSLTIRLRTRPRYPPSRRAWVSRMQRSQREPLGVVGLGPVVSTRNPSAQTSFARHENRRARRDAPRLDFLVMRAV
jgi:hypothetical protein